MQTNIRSDMFSVSTAAYRIFFKILKAQFLLKEHGNNPKIKAKDIWEEKDQAGRYYGLRLLVGTEISSPTYFYRKNSECRPSNGEFCNVNTDAFVNALEYIGIVPQKNVLNYSSIKLPENKIGHLYSSFLEQYKDEIFAEQLRVKKLQIVKGEFGEDDYDDDNDVNRLEKSKSKKSTFQGALDAVRSFYDNINSLNYYESWKILSPIKQNQKPWLGEFDKFSIGYQNTVSVRNVVVLFANQPSDNTVDCKIFYDDEINIYTSDELHNFSLMTVEQIDLFAAKVKQLQKGFEEKGFKEFGNITLQKLFDPSASEYIWYTCNFPADQLDKIFPSRTHVIVRRVLECRCILVKDEWLINDIRSIKSYSIQ